MNNYTVAGDVKPGIKVKIFERLALSMNMEPTTQSFGGLHGDSECVVLALEGARTINVLSGAVKAFHTYASGGTYGFMVKVLFGTHLEYALPDDSLQLIAVSPNGDVNLIPTAEAMPTSIAAPRRRPRGI